MKIGAEFRDIEWLIQTLLLIRSLVLTDFHFLEDNKQEYRNLRSQEVSRLEDTR